MLSVLVSFYDGEGEHPAYELLFHFMKTDSNNSMMINAIVDVVMMVVKVAWGAGESFSSYSLNCC